MTVPTKELIFEERRTALISAAVTGKIDVRAWQLPSPVVGSKMEPTATHSEPRAGPNE